MKNSQQPLPPPFFLQSHRNPITYFTSSAASKVPFSHVTCKKMPWQQDAQRHASTWRVCEYGYKDTMLSSTTVNTKSLWIQPSFPVLPFAFTTWPLLLHQRQLTSLFSFNVHSPVYNFWQTISLLLYAILPLSLSIYPMGASSNLHSTRTKCVSFTSLSCFMCFLTTSLILSLFLSYTQNREGGGLLNSDMRC